MADGGSSLVSHLSYLAIGRESTFKTYNTATAALPFNSASFKTIKENKILEQIENSRTYSKRIGLGKVIEAEVEAYVYPQSTAMAYLMENAFGAEISSATATGETTGGSAITHTFAIGTQDTNASLNINHRKGDSGTGFVFEYNGVKVDTITWSAELDEALKCNLGFKCVDSSNTSNDVSSVIATDTFDCLNFNNGRISVEDSTGSWTSTSFWHVQSVEFGIANNLKVDSESRRIGTDVLDVMPQGIANFTLNMTMRFDTMTAYDSMLNETQKSVELEFTTGTTITGSALEPGMKFQFPKCYVSDAGDPEIGGPDQILSANVVFHVLRDLSASGFAFKALLTNDTASY
jgi:hypothetical protein